MTHHSPYAWIWVVGERRDTLQRLIGSFKFQNAKAGAKILASLLHQRLPELPSDIIVVPIPTIAAHIRERGYDHTRLITEQFAKLRHLPVERLIGRQSSPFKRKPTKRLVPNKPNTLSPSPKLSKK